MQKLKKKDNKIKKKKKKKKRYTFNLLESIALSNKVGHGIQS